MSNTGIAGAAGFAQGVAGAVAPALEARSRRKKGEREEKRLQEERDFRSLTETGFRYDRLMELADNPTPENLAMLKKGIARAVNTLTSASGKATEVSRSHLVDKARLAARWDSINRPDYFRREFKDSMELAEEFHFDRLLSMNNLPPRDPTSKDPDPRGKFEQMMDAMRGDIGLGWSGIQAARSMTDRLRILGSLTGGEPTKEERKLVDLLFKTEFGSNYFGQLEEQSRTDLESEELARYEIQGIDDAGKRIKEAVATLNAVGYIGKVDDLRAAVETNLGRLSSDLVRLEFAGNQVFPITMQSEEVEKEIDLLNRISSRVTDAANERLTGDLTDEELEDLLELIQDNLPRIYTMLSRGAEQVSQEMLQREAVLTGGVSQQEVTYPAYPEYRKTPAEQAPVSEQMTAFLGQQREQYQQPAQQQQIVGPEQPVTRAFFPESQFEKTMWIRGAPFDSVMTKVSKFDEFIDPLAAEEKIDPDLIRSIIAWENAEVDPTKTGRDGDVGLMQVIPSTARDRGFAGTEAQLFEPDNNIRYGARQLRWLHDTFFPGDWVKVVQAYNGGGQGVTDNPSKSMDYAKGVMPILKTLHERATPRGGTLVSRSR